MISEASEKDHRAQTWIYMNWNQIFHTRFSLEDREHRVYGSIIVPDGNGWPMDYLAKFQGRYYVVECDINKSAKDIWHGFKVIGYRSAFCIDRNYRIYDVGAMIFFHDKLFRPEIRNLLAVSKIEYCTFREDDEESWKLVKTSLW